MKKLISIFLMLFSVAVVFHPAAAESVSLAFSYPPVDCPNVYPLPDGGYEAVYYTPDTSEFWLEQGYSDVINCVVEVFNSAGQSVWRFPVSIGNVHRDDADAFFYQNIVAADHIVFEYYLNHSFERYVSKKWSFAGESLSASFDTIWQQEEEFRYIISQYPYTLEMWPFGDAYNVPARLTCVVDDTSVDLPFSYGIHTTFVCADHRYFMLYEADDAGEGEENVVYLLIYEPDTHTLTYYRTDLDACSGHLAVTGDTLSFLRQTGGQTYRLYTAALDDARRGMFRFKAACEVSVDRNEVIDNLIPSGNKLLCVKGEVANRNMETEHWQSELCIMSAEGELTPVQKWDGEVDFLQGSAGQLQFVCEDGAGGYQIITIRDEDVASCST